MDKINIYLGKMKSGAGRVKGSWVDREGERFYKIENYHLMPPFFMSIVSDSDHWLFISSNGALSAGRKDPDNALFPYYNDDQITDSQDITGNKSIILVNKKDKWYFWEPFSPHCRGSYDINRNIYKNQYGNKIIFEEVNNDLGITFSYGWFLSEEHGFIKRSRIENRGRGDVVVTLLDGMQNIMPYGLSRSFQLQYSTLGNAYKKNELLPDSGIGIYYLSSIPTDKAEPSEGLKATVAWSVGLEDSIKLISSRQIEPFSKGEPVAQETGARACRGAYLASASFTLPGGKEREWYIVADLSKDSADIAALEKQIRGGENMAAALKAEIQKGTENLVRLAARADALMSGADQMTSARHFSNVLFNIMRGGVFGDHYQVKKKDYGAHLANMNAGLARSAKTFLAQMADTAEYRDLVEKARAWKNSDLERGTYEYLPLTFSRRHGDPSRPWNLFSIQLKNRDGSRRIYYEGNWRDIFQNWEALAFSFPEFIEGMIARFVNASTADGYNPYRITSRGIDWEVHDPKDPWSHIGYWGDHQVVYLLKLMEISAKFHPGRLEAFLGQHIFTYANVPYRLKSYPELLRDPHNTIDFAAALDQKIKKRVKRIGADAKLLAGPDGGIYKVNLAEKLLVTVLAKLANFIPGGGIWLCTQRPEWNDANNALVGYGVSVITLCYLRRFLEFCRGLFMEAGSKSVEISTEVKDLLQAMTGTFQEHRGLLQGEISDAQRKDILDLLGSAAGLYRERIYKNGFSKGKAGVPLESLSSFFKLALEYCDHTLKSNRRSDNLYHSYNLMEAIPGRGIAIRHLYEMLEGQVAVLSSGFLGPEQALLLLDALRASRMYRADQDSYLLYPDRDLPHFMEKNNIPADKVHGSQLLMQLLADGDTSVIRKDINGVFHFNGVMRNAQDLRLALKNLATGKYKKLAASEEPILLKIFEEVFDHQSFTGRSGTFYGYEGLGCIYWHMVSKLVLAVQENFYRAWEQRGSGQIPAALAGHYYAIRAGLGQNKTPELYGAFPTDPYSHTPGNSGAKQPGMTGQVKEDILCRWGELGVRVNGGCLSFNPALLRASEFGRAKTNFLYYDLKDTRREIGLEKNSLGFTFCQLPVVYHSSERERIVITCSDGQVKDEPRLTLDKETSAKIFSRQGSIARLDVYLKPACA